MENTEKYDEIKVEEKNGLLYITKVGSALIIIDKKQAEFMLPSLEKFVHRDDIQEFKTLLDVTKIVRETKNNRLYKYFLDCESVFLCTNKSNTKYIVSTLYKTDGFRELWYVGYIGMVEQMMKSKPIDIEPQISYSESSLKDSDIEDMLNKAVEFIDSSWRTLVLDQMFYNNYREAIEGMKFQLSDFLNS